MKPDHDMNAPADSISLPAVAPVSSTRSITRHLPTVARVLLGLLFVVFGLNGFLNFIPAPTTPPPEGAMAFGIALVNTGYMMPLIKGTEVLVGVLLLLNRFVPLALVVLAPVVVNIVAFHAFLAPTGFGMTVLIVGLQLYLVWIHRSVYRPLLTARAKTG